jgi:hypothetical protein
MRTLVMKMRGMMRNPKRKRSQRRRNEIINYVLINQILYKTNND